MNTQFNSGNEPQDDEILYPSFADVVKYIGMLAAIIVAIVFLSIAYHRMTTPHPLEVAADSVSFRINKLLSSQVDSIAIDRSTEPSDNLVAPPGTKQSSLNTDNEIPDWAVKLLQAAALLICLGQWNASWECIGIAVAILVVAGILTYINIKVMPYLRKKCKRCRHRGRCGWVTRVFCWLLVFFDYLIDILIVILFVVGIIMIVVCAYDLISAGSCLSGLIPEVLPETGGTITPN